MPYLQLVPGAQWEIGGELTCPNGTSPHQGRQLRGLGGQGKYKNGAPQYGFCEGGLGVCPQKIEILHALKCVLGDPEALFRACIQYIYTCKLLSSISYFRSKCMTYRALATRRIT